MLCYLGTGPRWYGRNPIKVYRRPYWEFQAVVSGRIAMVSGAGQGLLKQRHLWLSAPDHPHGWAGEPGARADVAVFHFLAIPEILARQVPSGGLLEIPLKREQAVKLTRLARQLEGYGKQPGPEMLMRHEHLLMELSLLVYESVSGPHGTVPDAVHQRVGSALAYFSENMRRNPGLEETARAAGTSSSHLRRHFHEVMHAPPKKIFDQLRFQRAMQLMAEPAMKHRTVSEACGFESPSAFSRAFKNRFGCSPEKWRG